MQFDFIDIFELPPLDPPQITSAKKSKNEK